MNIILVMVSSLNGRITRGATNTSQWWASTEDQRHFHSLLKKAKLIVMGSKTYEAARKQMIRRPGVLRVILTRDPKQYAQEVIPGRIEFTSESPRQLVNRLAKKYKRALLLGGSEVNALFFKAKLVNEFILTLEPLIFGAGKLLIGDAAFNARARLISIKKLNSRGTLLLRYKIL